MEIKKADLIKALDTVKPGLASKELVEQGTSFCFLNNNVVTFNDEISISCPIDLELEGAVNATELYAFINKVKSEDIELIVEDSEIILKTGKGRAGLRLQAEIKLPISEIGTIKKYAKIPEGFLKALKFCMGSCSTDMSSPIITCVNIAGAVLQSSDQYRIAHVTLSEEFPTKELLIPARICNNVINFKPTKVAEGDGWIHFKNEKGAVLSCRVYDEKFPDIAQYLIKKGTEVTFPKEMKEMLEKAMIFSKKDSAIDERVKVSFGKGKMELRSESSSGWFEEKGRTEYTGELIEFHVTPYLLKDILSETNKAILKDSKLLFAADNWLYMTMLRAAETSKQTK